MTRVRGIAVTATTLQLFKIRDGVGVKRRRTRRIKSRIRAQNFKSRMVHIPLGPTYYVGSYTSEDLRCTDNIRNDTQLP